MIIAHAAQSPAPRTDVQENATAGDGETAWFEGLLLAGASILLALASVLTLTA